MTIPISGVQRQIEGELNELMIIFEDVLKSGQLVLSKQNHILENQLKEYVSCLDVVLTGNGTDSLEIIFRFLKLKPGESILTVGNAGGYATIAARSCNLNVCYVDVDIDTALMDVDELSHSLEINQVSAVVYTHLYGNLGPIQRVADICNKFGVPLIEDCSGLLVDLAF
jgi:dTDP-3-amino-2,3,6-trideoxy-4-keto-D-glucose/dTDP-3-amino-3,4,6-trideoxy-alpha-D-glucose/dTDP-2,6-dideoxy-D-kanosamine transaminase